MNRRKFLGDSAKALGGIVLGGSFYNEAFADSYWTITARGGITEIDNLRITYNNPRGGSNDFKVYYGVNERGRTMVKVNGPANVGLGRRADDFRVRAYGDGLSLVFNPGTPHGKFNIRDNSTRVVLNLNSNDQIRVAPAIGLDHRELDYPRVTIEGDAEIYSGRCYFSVKGRDVRLGVRHNAPNRSTELQIDPLGLPDIYHFRQNGNIATAKKVNFPVPGERVR